jgi:hydrogenase maturation protein HypF
LGSRDEVKSYLDAEGAIYYGWGRDLRGARIIVEGIVQGVGFRPFIHRMAESLSLKGWVLNSTRGVEIEVEGSERSIMDFYEGISAKSPAAASILRKAIEFHAPTGYDSFEIRESEEDDLRTALISPDIAVCGDCLGEMLNPSDRRYMYPFINCTNCGPRFTIIESLPYDRPRTSMKWFAMCTECTREYEDMANRRYHAQPNACKICGPTIQLLSRDGAPIAGDPLKGAAGLLASGHVIAVKGIGGFHLACDAEDGDAVNRLRAWKGREMKPFAIMSSDSEAVLGFCEMSSAEKGLLEGPKRPIILLRKRPRCTISEPVSPGTNCLGVMLPYTPIHHLLFRPPIRALVMTSANVGDEPIIMDNDEARMKLASLVDFTLVHNRDIVSRCDDSVVKFIGGKARVLRRSRGYAPYPIKVDFELGESLACGGELNNTFCLTKGDKAILSQHIGDLKTLATYSYYREAIAHFEATFSIDPQIVAYDIHPEYMSTKYALERRVGELVGVQHHHAHVVSCMAENAVRDDVIGVAMDGAGYGTDGRTWGCEFLLAGLSGFERLGHLTYVHLPGGDAAAKEPYRMAISYLDHSYGDGFEGHDVCKRWNRDDVELLTTMIHKGINSPLASSAGRLFDAVSSLLGICDFSTYEGQAAMELEAIASDDVSETYTLEVRTNSDGTFLVDSAEMVANIVEDFERHIPAPIIAGKFHNAMARAILEGCQLSREMTGLKDVALSGGVFQNKLLTEKALRLLDVNRFVCHLHEVVPTNDGGISLGQAVVAASKRKGV